MLTYIYERATYKYQVEPIQSIDDAKTLAKFAHKYDIMHMLDASEKYLIEKVSRNDPQLRAKDGSHPLVALTTLAEQCGLHNLLAHCEVLLVQQDDRSLWTPEAVTPGQISQDSLLRMLRAYQIHSTRVSQQSSAYCYSCGYNTAGKGTPAKGQDCYASVAEVLIWQSTDTTH